METKSTRRNPSNGAATWLYGVSTLYCCTATTWQYPIFSGVLYMNWNSRRALQELQYIMTSSIVRQRLL
jgi:hypothetical protein